MINLIPDHIKSDGKYALRNNRLVRYTAVSLFTVVVMVAVTVFSIVRMSQSQQDLQAQLDAQNQRLASFKAIEAKGQKLSDQINTIKELLTRQVKFSQLLPNFAEILPSGSVLLQLNFQTNDLTGQKPAGTPATAATVEKPFVIRAAVADRAIAGTLLENIKARNDLFKSADLLEVTFVEPVTASGAGGASQTNSIAQKYPYQVTINAYFQKKTTTPSTTTTGVKP